MKKVLYFYLETCPYCREADAFIAELTRENPEYAKIEIEKVEERRESERADKYDYYYVPTFYVDGEKLHEGASTKEMIKRVLDSALC